MRRQLEQFAADCGLKLEPFQKRIARAARTTQREFVCLLPRGNGKTHLLAIIALHHLLTVDDAAVYCAAASREQARILFEAAAGYARRLGHPNIVHRHLELRWCPDPSEPRTFTRHMRVLPAQDAGKLHGLTSRSRSLTSCRRSRPTTSTSPSRRPSKSSRGQSSS